MTANAGPLGAFVKPVERGARLRTGWWPRGSHNPVAGGGRRAHYGLGFRPVEPQGDPRPIPPVQMRPGDHLKAQTQPGMLVEISERPI